MSFLSFFFKSKSKAYELIQILDVQSFRNAVENNSVQLVDVRTANEFNSGHIAKALNIDFFDKANFQKSFENLDKKQPVYLYCRSGNRSQKAAVRLLDMGFTEIIDLKGGYSAWQNN